MRDFDLILLASKTENFSGAEIEQVIIEAMHYAFSSKLDGHRRDFITEDILRAIEVTVPLASLAKEQIVAFKQWAAQAGARSASNDVQLVEELKQYSSGNGISPLEVD